MKKFFLACLLASAVPLFAADDTSCDEFFHRVINKTGEFTKEAVISTLNVAYFVTCLCCFGHLTFPD